MKSFLLEEREGTAHSSQRGTKSHLKKPHLKSQFPTEITLRKSQQNFQSRLKSLPSRIYTSESFQDDWSQVNQLIGTTSFFQLEIRQGRDVFCMKSDRGEMYSIYLMYFVNSIRFG